MRNRNILISGASIAGPALAYWLRRYGFTPTVLERAPELRAGGQAVDFRGPAHLGVLERMGVLPEIRRRQTRMGEQVVLDAGGRPRLRLPSSFISGQVEILRGDLSEVLYRATDGVEYLFGDFVTSLTDTGAGVEVTFDRAAPRTFDLVIGADGLHSGIRALAFGPEAEFVRFGGYYIAGATVPNHLDLDHSGVIYNVPGRGVMLGSLRENTAASACFVFASDELAYDRHDPEQQRKILTDVYSGAGWEVPTLLTAVRDAPDLYFDSISQVRMDSWVKGRVALLGDAGYGATVGGLGSGLAVVCAAVLAGELDAAGGAHELAFARYADRIGDYVRGCQKIAGNAGPFLAPRTQAAIWRRDQLYRALSSRALAGYFERFPTKAASDITLPDYR